MNQKQNGATRSTLARLFRAKQTEMLAVLQGTREAFEHPVAKGKATEKNWLSFLQTYLPVRYRSDSGIVVDSSGETSEQIDVVIFDRQYTPILFDTGGEKYFPAESVYAVFEVKQTMNRTDLGYASGKVASVRQLHRTSTPIVHAGGTFDPRKPLRIIGGVLATGSSWKPPFGEPFENSLATFSENSQIDLACALSEGAASIRYDGDGQPAIKRFGPELSLVSLLFSLLAKLQALGTVPAMDYEEYLTGPE